MSIQAELTRITNAKASIVAAIEGKGVTVPGGTLLDGMASLIESIEAGGGVTGPYVEETYNSSGDLTAAVLHGQSKIRISAFRDSSSLTSVTIPDSVTRIGNSAFYSCSSLTNLIIPDGVTGIDDYAFYSCSSLTNLIIPDGVTKINNNAFRKCSSLTSITIPDGVTRIGNNAFGDCSSLTSVTFNGTPSYIAYNAFSGCPNLTTINVPWAKGAVSNAPWGATEATINYNHTGA